ncbi:thioredoxin [Candidatus Uhrbacteria bacterium CG10_big_fil_rev_8_21_14_0_10_48_11]|uniref:Thioredoxin n=1 Tax=Candidatus Uhrbacteria bacterium CG10_big_fil_rev_8_21_14_0_10_48_11 TaxID=1975037 RepID=A0A2M8LEN8_9BACT|nr:MAG: thioredoxin [Candidatus Uhrbacteria bacterium CG10_big_fil_rev_8_21_14_0_10_48_11]
MAEKILSDQNFQSEVLQSSVPVLVDFWAPWCGPCLVMGPIIQKLAGEYADKPVTIGKLNVDENQTTAGSYGIMSIPTILIFKDGKVHDQIVGVQSEALLRQKINGVIG